MLAVSGGEAEQTSLQDGILPLQPWERQPVEITVYPACCLVGWWKDPRAALPGLLLYVTGQELFSQLGLF